MADDGQAPEGGSLFKGKPIAGVPRPLAVGGIIILGTAAMVWWWHKKSAAEAAASGTSTTGAAGAGAGTDDSALDDELLGALQQQPGGGTSGGGGDSGGGGTSGGGSSSGDGSSSGGTVFTPGGPGTTTDEAGSMHGISLAQARYLFDTGNQAYTFNPATGEFTRWSGTPVAGQVYYAGPMNWSQTLKGGNITGGTKGHPAYKSGTAPKAPAPKKPAKKPAPKKPAKKK